MLMYKKIGVVGDKDSVLAFKALGVDIFPVIEVEEARKTVDKLAMTELCCNLHNRASGKTYRGNYRTI